MRGDGDFFLVCPTSSSHFRSSSSMSFACCWSVSTMSTLQWKVSAHPVYFTLPFFCSASRTSAIRQTLWRVCNKRSEIESWDNLLLDSTLSVTYIEKLVHLLPVLCLAPSNQYQLALKIPKVIQGEVILRQLLPCTLQLEMNHIMNAVDCLCVLGAHPVASICQDVFHLPKGSDLNWALCLFDWLVPLKLLIAIHLPSEKKNLTSQ